MKNNDHMSVKIRELQAFAESVCTMEKERNYLCEQIQVCIEMCIPLTEKLIEEWAVMPFSKMRCEIWKFKFEG